MKISGIIGYTVTPFDPRTQGVDLAKLGEVIDNLLAGDVDAIAALGSAGEAAYLTAQEWQQVAEFTVKHVAGRVPVIIGIAALTTAQATTYAKYAHQFGADIIMLSPFSYYQLSEQEIFEHYQQVSKASPLPIMIYNNPAVCGVDMTPELMLAMVADIENVVAIKESSGDIQRMHKIYHLSEGAVPFFNGCNHMALEALTAGAAGWCTAAPCLIGDKPKQLLQAVANSEFERARGLFYQQFEFLEFIVNSGLAAAVKAGFALKGMDVGGPRAPLLPLNDAKQKQLAQLLSNLSCG